MFVKNRFKKNKNAKASEATSFFEKIKQNILLNKKTNFLIDILFLVFSCLIIFLPNILRVLKNKTFFYGETFSFFYNLFNETQISTFSERILFKFYRVFLTSVIDIFNNIINKETILIILIIFHTFLAILSIFLIIKEINLPKICFSFIILNPLFIKTFSESTSLTFSFSYFCLATYFFILFFKSGMAENKILQFLHFIFFIVSIFLFIFAISLNFYYFFIFLFIILFTKYVYCSQITNKNRLILNDRFFFISIILFILAFLIINDFNSYVYSNPYSENNFQSSAILRYAKQRYSDIVYYSFENINIINFFRNYDEYFFLKTINIIAKEDPSFFKNMEDLQSLKLNPNKYYQDKGSIIFKTYTKVNQRNRTFKLINHFPGIWFIILFILGFFSLFKVEFKKIILYLISIFTFFLSYLDNSFIPILAIIISIFSYYGFLTLINRSWNHKQMSYILLYFIFLGFIYTSIQFTKEIDQAYPLDNKYYYVKISEEKKGEYFLSLLSQTPYLAYKSEELEPFLYQKITYKEEDYFDFLERLYLYSLAMIPKNKYNTINTINKLDIDEFYFSDIFYDIKKKNTLSDSLNTDILRQILMTNLLEDVDFLNMVKEKNQTIRFE